MDIDYLRAYAVLDGERLDSLWVEIERLRAENGELLKKLDALREFAQVRMIEANIDARMRNHSEPVHKEPAEE